MHVRKVALDDGCHGFVDSKLDKLLLIHSHYMRMHTVARSDCYHGFDDSNLEILPALSVRLPWTIVAMVSLTLINSSQEFLGQ